MVRIGFAFAVFDAAGDLVAAARGVPPWWIQGIHGAELYGLLEAVQATMPKSAGSVEVIRGVVMKGPAQVAGHRADR